MPRLLLSGCFLLLICFSPLHSQSYAQSPSRDTTRFEQIFIMGLQVNIGDGLHFLDSLNDSSLTPRQQNIRQQYYSRFRAGDEPFAYPTTDPALRRLFDLYHHYWRNALLDSRQLPHLDSLLADSVTSFLLSQETALSAVDPDSLRENFTQYLSDYLDHRHIYSAVGKTGQLFDLLLHLKETPTSYHVTTPEETLQVTVVFMDSCISNGWEEYATFGRYFPGGWATNDALYCVRSTYDTASENFRISYLKHEGKHFADYRRFPKLTGADLEYRAKLVELCYARESIYDLIRIFTRNSSTDRRNPHGFANRCVIRDLASACGLPGESPDLILWKNLSIETIHSAATSLLVKNSTNLLAAGADTVEQFIQ